MQTAQHQPTSATAIGSGALAIETSATAIGASATASSVNSTAVGETAEASGVGSIAVGQGSGATHDNSMVFGVGASSAVDNQIVLGLANQTLTVAGLPSAASLAAQGAVTGLVTTDANGNLASDGGALQTSVNTNTGWDSYKCNQHRY